VNGVVRPSLARVSSDGTLDAGFLAGLSGPNGSARKLALAPAASGRAAVAVVGPAGAADRR
jgi:hypothetical protein